MTSFQEEILNQTQKKVSQVFDQVPKREHLWVHSFSHVKRVVANMEKLLASEKENLAAKMSMPVGQFAFLCRLAAWLHDLGRTKEDQPTYWGDNFNHATESAKMAKKILEEIIFQFGDKAWASDFPLKEKERQLVLQAVAEHNQPTPNHPKNLITRILQDADRGDGFSYQGIMMVLNYSQTINTPQTETEEASRKEFLKVWPLILKDPQLRRRVAHWLRYLSSWYTGGWALAKEDKLKFIPEKVSPLYTKTAKKIFKPGFELISRYLNLLETAKK